MTLKSINLWPRSLQKREGDVLHKNSSGFVTTQKYSTLWLTVNTWRFLNPTKHEGELRFSVVWKVYREISIWGIPWPLPPPFRWSHLPRDALLPMSWGKLVAHHRIAWVAQLQHHPFDRFLSSECVWPTDGEWKKHTSIENVWLHDSSNLGGF